MMKKQAIFKKILVRFASLVIKTKKGKKKLNKMFKILYSCELIGVI